MVDEPDDTPPTDATPPADAAPPTDAVTIPDPPPTLPGRGAFLLAIGAIVVAGGFGAVIGYGLTELQCTGDCGLAVAIGTIVGAAVAAIGVGVVAVLTLRAMAEWRAHPADQPNTRRRNPSA